MVLQIWRCPTLLHMRTSGVWNSARVIRKWKFQITKYIMYTATSPSLCCISVRYLDIVSYDANVVLFLASKTLVNL